MTNSMADLTLFAAMTVVATLVTVTGILDGSVVRILIVLPLLVLIPGYAMLAAAFPSAGPWTGGADRSTVDDGSGWTPNIAGLEWWVLSVAGSVLVVPAVAVVVIASPIPYNSASLGGLLGFLSGAALALAMLRRTGLPPSQRYHAGPREWFDSVEDVLTVDTVPDAALTIGLVLGVTLLLASGAYALNSGPQSEPHTELSLLTENESGEYAASDYPEEVAAGESFSITIGIGNQEGEDMEYTAVVQQQRVEDGEVVDRTRLDAVEAVISDGSTGTGDRSLTPTADPGETVRIAVLLYVDDIPETATMDSAYRSVHFWTTIVDGDDAGLESDDDGGEDAGDADEAEDEGEEEDDDADDSEDGSDDVEVDEDGVDSDDEEDSAIEEGDSDESEGEDDGDSEGDGDESDGDEEDDEGDDDDLDEGGDDEDDGLLLMGEGDS